MKKEMLFTMLMAILMTNGILVGRLVKMPSKAVLEKRLDENGFDAFNGKVNLSYRFADKEMYATGVNRALDWAICDFCREYPDYLQDNPKVATHCSIVRKSKEDILKLLLEHDDLALHELKRLGIIKQ
jgi:hypothetical protein